MGQSRVEPAVCKGHLVSITYMRKALQRVLLISSVNFFDYFFFIQIIKRNVVEYFIENSSCEFCKGVKSEFGCNSRLGILQHGPSTSFCRLYFW